MKHLHMTSRSTGRSPSGGVERSEGRPAARDEYPATRAHIVDACFDLGERWAGEKAWLLAALPDRLFESADALLAALLPSTLR